MEDLGADGLYFEIWLTFYRGVLSSIHVVNVTIFF